MKKLLLLLLLAAPVGCEPAPVATSEAGLVTLKQPVWCDDRALPADMFFQQTGHRPDGVPVGNRTLHACYEGTDMLYDPHAASIEVQRPVDGGPWTTVRSLPALGVFGGITEAWHQWVPIQYRVKITGDTWTGGQIVYSEPYLTYTAEELVYFDMWIEHDPCFPPGCSMLGDGLRDRFYAKVQHGGIVTLPFGYYVEIKLRDAATGAVTMDSLLFETNQAHYNQIIGCAAATIDDSWANKWISARLARREDSVFNNGQIGAAASLYGPEIFLPADCQRWNGCGYHHIICCAENELDCP